MDRFHRVSAALIGLSVPILGLSPIIGTVLALAGLALRKSTRRFPAETPLLVLGAAFMTSALVNSSHLVPGLIHVGIGGLFVGVIYLAVTRMTIQDAIALMRGFLVLVALQIPYSIYQVFSQGLTRAHGTMFHSNQLGFVAAFSLAVFLSWAVRESSKTTRIMAGLGALSSVGLIGLSGSRSAMIAAVFVCVLTGLRPMIGRRSRKIVISSVAGSLVIIGILVSIVGLPGTRQINSSANFLDPAGRSSLWATATTMIAHRPVLGFGPAGWLGDAEQFEPQLRTDRVPHPHNFFLELAVYAGVSSVFAFGWLFGGIARSLIQRPADPFAQLGLSVLLVVGICIATDSVLSRVENVMLLVMMLGMAGANSQPAGLRKSNHI